MHPYLGTACALSLLLAACEGGASSTDAGASIGDRSPPAVADNGAALGGLASEYRGTIDHNAIVVRLHHDTNRVTGTYFYESSGTTVKLAGSSTGAHMSLDETLEDAKNATFALDLAAGGGLSGTRTGAHGEPPTPVHLEPIRLAARPTAALVFKRTVRAEKAAGGDPKSKDICRVNLSFAEAYGLSTTVEARVNAELAPPSDLALPEKCDHAIETTADYRVAYNGDGILSVRMTSSITDGPGATPKHGGRAVTLLLTTGGPLKLFGDVVKPKAERTFETALSAQVAAASRKSGLDANARKQIDEALAFSPPFVIEEKGVRVFADTLQGPVASVGAEGLFVKFATLPRPAGPAAALWDK